MRLLLCLIALVLPVLVAAEPVPASPAVELPPAASALLDRIIAANRILEPEMDEASVRADFLALVATARSGIAASPPTIEARIAVLNRVVLGDRQVSYLSNQYWRDSSLVAALQRRRGNCLACSTLYTAVGRALDLPISTVFIPGHAFVCWNDGERRLNIETTAQGRVIGDLQYLSRFDIDPEQMDFFGWMRPMRDVDLLTELDLVAAQHLHGQQRHAEAVAVLGHICEQKPRRGDLALLLLAWQADMSGDRAALQRAAEALADDASAARPARLAAFTTLADEYAARLDRARERDALKSAYGLAPWHQQDEILNELSTCLRGLRDHAGAVLCMELAVARDPEDLFKRAWLAGMLVEAGRIDEGLAQIADVRKANPEETYFTTMQAGLLVTAGRREEGRAIFDAQVPPRTGLQIWETNRAWFFAVWGDRELFYPQFEKALQMATDPGILSWIAEDDDLDPYRQEPRFTALVEAARTRLLAGAPQR